MARRFLSIGAIGLMLVPAFVAAQNAPAPTPAPTPTSASAPASAIPPPVVTKTVPAQSSAPPPAPTPAPAPPPQLTQQPAAPPAASTDVTVNIGGSAPASGGLAPLPNVELPPDMARPPTPAKASASTPLLPPLAPSPPSGPPAKLTPAQIASQIAPNFNVARDYTRLTQCYGTADFMGAVTRIQASRPGATPQVINVARSIATLQDGMQPMVLAASTVRGEARFRADYDAIARRGQNELATSRTPNVTMQRRLATLDACRADVVRWRGGR